MSNKTYDIWKAIAQIILPALITLYGVIGTTLNIPYTEAVITIATAVDTCLGTILAKLSSDYHKELNKDKGDE